ncbi:MAG: hypothetical protein KatS3mg076_1839 [Candidatus Binatia bacterium]|nr:MAG: hypothetical protein KatS3mg076_1839 [Candidatus Binatia bacterium]
MKRRASRERLAKAGKLGAAIEADLKGLGYDG